MSRKALAALAIALCLASRLSADEPRGAGGAGAATLRPRRQEPGASAAAAAAQRTPRTDARPEGEGVLYWREEYAYPAQGRRSPFENLLEAAELGPDFGDLDLVGIINSPGDAVATLVDRTAKKRYRVREGDTVGNAEVLEIRRDEVVFNVTVFGVSRVETLRVRKKERAG